MTARQPGDLDGPWAAELAVYDVLRHKVEQRQLRALLVYLRDSDQDALRSLLERALQLADRQAMAGLPVGRPLRFVPGSGVHVGRNVYVWRPMYDNDKVEP